MNKKRLIELLDSLPDEKEYEEWWKILNSEDRRLLLTVVNNCPWHAVGGILCPNETIYIRKIDGHVNIDYAIRNNLKPDYITLVFFKKFFINMGSTGELER